MNRPLLILLLCAAAPAVAVPLATDRARYDACVAQATSISP